ncbi:hypothetical protein BH09GEM1_BH09GEM1_43000 [soil metagenome]
MTPLIRRFAVVFAFVVAIPATAKAQLITFDDLSCGSASLGSAVPAGYAGFTFGSRWTCYDMTDPGRPSAGIGANVSGKNVAFNRSGSGSFMSRATPFTFTSAYITGIGSTYDFEGWLGSTKLYDKILAIAAAGYRRRTV